MRSCSGNSSHFFRIISNTLSKEASSILDEIFESEKQASQSQIDSLQEIADTYRELGKETEAGKVESVIKQIKTTTLTAEKYFEELQKVTEDVEEAFSKAVTGINEQNIAKDKIIKSSGEYSINDIEAASGIDFKEGFT